MARILIVYATVEGQTARIAERIGTELSGAGHDVEVVPARAGGAMPRIAAFDAVVVGASVHYGRHPVYLARELRLQREALQARSSAFFSVSLSADGPGAKRAAAWRYVRRFLRGAGWQPAQTAVFGGALRYSAYSGWKRFLVRLFVRAAGGDTDASRDYEYTDWHGVATFARAFAATV